MKAEGTTISVMNVWRNIVSPPKFTSREEANKTAAACALTLSHGCNPSDGFYANALLKLFQPFIQYSLDGSDRFLWAGMNYDVHCEQDRCWITQVEPDDPFEIDKALLGAALVGLGGCDDSPRPFNPNTVDAVVEVEQPQKAFEFCAKTGVVPENADCHLMNAKFGNKISSKIFLQLFVASESDCEKKYVDSKFAYLQYDFDKLMTYLLSSLNQSYLDYYHFTGDAAWPEGYLNSSCPRGDIVDQNKLTTLMKMASTSGHPFFIVPDSNTWSVRAYMRQQPGLCWAVYEAPCK